MTLKHCAAVIALGLTVVTIQAQSSKLAENWFMLDPVKDKVNGTGAEEALARLKEAGKKSQTIIVAVLDSGVEVDHEDLQDVMWTNPGEIPGNGIDDDANGYADDIHGWNFLGGKDGRNIQYETLELTREYARLSKRFQAAEPKNLHGAAAEEYKYFQSVKAGYEEKRAEAEGVLAKIDAQFVKIDDAFNTVGKAVGKKDFSAEELSRVNPGSNAALKSAVAILQNIMSQGIGSRADWEEIKKEERGHYASEVEYHLNPDYNPREIVGDDPYDLSSRIYGNNDYEGPDAMHGTHVAGTIAAVRDNGKGINGIADNVRIMSVRCVAPDGDERDKDVANAIYYAVDNGASVINMSFGKNYSPQKDYVDAAVRYAAEHDVLLVHAAGNESDNNDAVSVFPNDTYLKPAKKGLFKKEKNVPSWIEVGALSFKKDENRVAKFSNYGKKNVDLFAPGVQIYSTVPDNGYRSLQGTSMACPTVSGVAALIRSYYPDLSARQVKEILEQSVVKQEGEVYKPGTTEKVPFAELCSSGGVVSASNAVALAAQTKGQKVKKSVWREVGSGKHPVAKKAKAATP